MADDNAPKAQEELIPTLNLKTNKVELMEESKIPDAVKSRTHSLKKESLIQVKNRLGEPGTIRAEDAEEAFNQGFTMDPKVDRDERENERKFGNRPLDAFATGAASGITFGFSDQAITKSGLMTPEELKQLKERNESADIAGEIIGTVAPLIVSGGTSAAGKVIQKAGAGVVNAAKVGARAEGLTAKALSKAIQETGERKFAKKVLQEALPKMAGSAAEGAFYGTGQVIREDAIGNIDLNAENVLRGAGLGALIGGSFGGLLGSMQATAPVVRKGLGGAAETVTGSLKSKVGKSLDKDKAVSKYLNLTPAQESKLTRTGAKLEDIGQFLVEKGQLKTFSRGKSVYANLQNVKQSAGERIGAIIKQADELLEETPIPFSILPDDIGRRVMDSLDNNFIEKLGKKPGYKAQIAPIEKLRKEWSKFREQRRPMSFKDLHQLRMDVDNLIKYEKDPMKLTLKEEALRDVRTVLSDTLKERIGQVDTLTGQKHSNLLQGLLAANKDFSMSARVLPYMERKLSKDANKNFLNLSDIVLGGLTVPLGAEVAAATTAAKRFAESDLKNRLVILSNIEKQKVKNHNVILDSLNNYLGIKTKKLKRAVTPTTVLLGLSLDKDVKAKKDESKQEAFKRVSDQIQEIASNPIKLQNTFNIRTMRMREAAPGITDALLMKTQSALEFLVSKMPKDPKPNMSLQPHLDEYQPSSQELAKFERYIAAVMDPMSVVQDLADGQVTREGVEALKAVYPELYVEVQQQTIQKIGEMKERLPYSKRLEIGILLDLPTDSSLDPNHIQGLQQQFDPGSQKTGAGVSAQGVINPTVTGITGIDAANRTAGPSERVVKRRNK